MKKNWKKAEENSCYTILVWENLIWCFTPFLTTAGFVPVGYFRLQRTAGPIYPITRSHSQREGQGRGLAIRLRTHSLGGSSRVELSS
jgi:hypothetical protein